MHPICTPQNYSIKVAHYSHHGQPILMTLLPMQCHQGFPGFFSSESFLFFHWWQPLFLSDWPDSNRRLTGLQSLSVSCWMLWARDKQVNWLDNRIGDTVYIDNIWTLMKYEVTDIQVISPDDVDAIKIQDGRDLVTLLTCYPPNTGGRQRLLVFCERSEE